MRCEGRGGGWTSSQAGQVCEVHDTHTLREMRPEGQKDRMDRMDATLYPVYVPALRAHEIICGIAVVEKGSHHYPLGNCPGVSHW